MSNPPTDDEPELRAFVRELFRDDDAPDRLTVETAPAPETEPEMHAYVRELFGRTEGE